jgi:hypothetical protein
VRCTAAASDNKNGLIVVPGCGPLRNQSRYREPVPLVGTLALQKGQDVYLCEAKDLSIQPTAFECWPVK